MAVPIQKVISVLTLSWVLILCLSCQPKDEKLIRPDASTQTKTEPIASDVSVKLALATFDKTVEAVSYLKVILNPDFAAQKNLTVETVSAKDNQTTYKIISAGVPNETSSLVQISEVNLLAVISRNEAQEILSVLIKDDSGGQAKTELFTKNNNQKSEHASVLLVSKSKRYLIAKSDVAGFFLVETDTVDSVKSFNRKNLNEVYGDSLSQVSANFTIQWDGKAESLNQKVNITAAVPEYQAQSSSTRTKMISEGPFNLSISLNECTFIEGSIALSSVKTKPDTPIEKQNLVFSSSAVIVSGKPFKYKWADCTTRPIVDLTQSL